MRARQAGRQGKHVVFVMLPRTPVTGVRVTLAIAVDASLSYLDLLATPSMTLPFKLIIKIV